MKRLLAIFIVLLFFLIPKPVYAQTTDINIAKCDNYCFINIVNPVRISQYLKDPQKSLESQYKVISKSSLSATWLLTYDSIKNEDFNKIVKKFDKNQELGIFFEITPSFAEASGVIYNNSGSWHHANSLFLSGYSQEDRKKMIDSVFEAFKNNFGYYPRSVGSWWIDSYSLSYMAERYGIIANLGLADQFAMDGYQVWGTYWSTPFYPSKLHSGIPAGDLANKLNVVTIQWAARDPYNGYFNSLYSIQDYKTNPVNLNTEYFEKIVKVYAERKNNQFGQITIGLESDLSSEAYSGEYSNQINVAKRLVDNQNFKTETMSGFAKWYISKFPEISPVHVVESEDLLGKPLKIVWYQSPRYRIGLTYNYENKEIKIIDFRSYQNDFEEPYNLIPNKEFKLSIYIPSYFDEVTNIGNIWKMILGGLKNTIYKDDSLSLIFDKGEIIFNKEILIIKGITDIPDVLEKSPSLNISHLGNRWEIKPSQTWIVGEEGYIFRDLTDVATHSLSRKKIIVLIFAGSFIFLITSALILLRFSEKKRIVVLTFLILPLIYFCLRWYRENSTNYYVSQAEIDALVNLSVQPKGKVVVVDHECLGCEWHSSVKPAVYANKRDYVQYWGKHPIVFNSSVFEAKTQIQAKKEFDKLNAKYIYLAKVEGYIEKIPFSPGDLDIEKIYGNANAEVWRVK